MKIFEIDDSDIVNMNLADVEYTFEEYLKKAKFNMEHTKSFPLAIRQNAYQNSVILPMMKINRFVDKCEATGVPDMMNDPHVQRAVQIADELSKIKKPE